MLDAVFYRDGVLYRKMEGHYDMWLPSQLMWVEVSNRLIG